MSENKELANSDLWELIQIQGIMLEQVKQITRVVSDRRMLPITKKELTHSLGHAVERLERLESTAIPSKAYDKKRL